MMFFSAHPSGSALPPRVQVAMDVMRIHHEIASDEVRRIQHAASVVLVQYLLNESHLDPEEDSLAGHWANCPTEQGVYVHAMEDGRLFLRTVTKLGADDFRVEGITALTGKWLLIPDPQ